MHFEIFVKESKRFIRNFGDHDTLAMVRPSNYNAHLLGKYGIVQHVPAIAAKLCLESEISSVVHRMLLASREIQGSGSGPQLLHRGEMLWPRHPPWAHLCGSTMLVRARDSAKDQALSNITSRGQPPAISSQREKPAVYVLFCPNCDKPADFAKRKLFWNRTWQQITCNSASCRRTAVSSRWCCPCGTSWAKCEVHRSLGFACGADRGQVSQQYTRAAAEGKCLRDLKRLSELGELGTVEARRVDQSRRRGTGKPKRSSGSIGALAWSEPRSAVFTDCGRKVRKVSEFRPCDSGEKLRNFVPTCYAISLGQDSHRRRQDRPHGPSGENHDQQSPVLDELRDAEALAVQDLHELEKSSLAVTWTSVGEAASDSKAEKSNVHGSRGSRDGCIALDAEIAAAGQMVDHSNELCREQEQALRDLSELQRSGLAVRWPPAFS